MRARLLTVTAVACLLLGAGAWADPTQYTLQSGDGKTFTVKDHLGRPRSFKAKRTCQGIRGGHPVMFERGGPNVTCISAVLRDLVTNASCSVWCLRPSDDKLAIKPHAGGSAKPGRAADTRATSLMDLTKPRDTAADAGTSGLPTLTR